MDVIRSRRGAGSMRTVIVATLLAAVILAAISILPRLLSNSTGGIVVDRASLVIDTVKRGTFSRSISASGSLASQSVRVVDAVQPGVVEQVFVKAGSAVAAGDAIARLANPDLDAAVVAARSALQVANAQLASVREEAKASTLAQESSLAGAQAQMLEDMTTAQSLEGLHQSGLVADSTYRVSLIKRQQSQRQVEINRSQVSVDAANQQAKIAAAQAQVAQAAAMLNAKEQEVSALDVRAGAAGVVQIVDVNPGVRVDAGAELAKIADQSSLLAALQVPESEAHEVFIGMPAVIDTGNGSVEGRVSRIAPSATSGTVAVEVAFRRALPAGARPELNVNGTILLQTIRQALSISRPAGASDNTTLKLYKLEGMHAVLTQVRLGSGSPDRVQVLSGLDAGDSVVVSDTSGYNGQNQLTLR